MDWRISRLDKPVPLSEERRTYTVESRACSIEGSDKKDEVQLNTRLGPRVQRRSSDSLDIIGVTLKLANFVTLLVGDVAGVGGMVNAGLNAAFVGHDSGGEGR